MKRRTAPGLQAPSTLSPYTRGSDLLLLLLILLAFAARVMPGSRIIDDAFITFRYARNLLNGFGFVYNPGEAVLGTTTPLYTLMLAGFGLISGSMDFPTLAPILNALADCLSVALMFAITRRLTGETLPALVVGALWAVSPRSVTFAIAGMETSWVVALMLAACWAWLVDRSRMSAFITGLAVLMRPDALIWAGPLGLAILITRWQGRRDQPPVNRLAWAELAIFLAVIAPWLIYGTFTFGSPLTRSFIAKLAAYRPEPGQALMTFAAHAGIPFYEHLTLGLAGTAFNYVMYPVLALIGCLALARRDLRALPLMAFPWLYVLTYAIFNPPMFHWYLVPPMAIYILCSVCGVWAVTRIRKAGWVVGAAGALWLVFSLKAWTLHPGYGQDRPAPVTAWNEPEMAQQAAGEFLAPLAAGGKRVAAADIGAAGWYSDALVLDTVGLISPEVTRYYPIDPALRGDAPYSVPPDLIFDQRPDFIMLLEAYGKYGLFKDPRFAEQYRLIKDIAVNAGHSNRLLIFERIGE
jgi:hypothetical protein